jgi:aryl-alcohol dehydrogenase-like predicted oxidoreductase
MNIVLGTMTWGRETDKPEARRIYDLARESGVTWFDTAAIYGEGKAEQWLGEFCRDDPEVKISTKVGYNGEDPLDQLKECVKRLGRPVSVCFHHHWMRHGSFKAVFRLEKCRQLGLAGEVGLSNCAAWQAALVSTEIRIRWLQVLYNLFKRQAEVELLPLAKDRGWTVMAYSPLASGLLTGKYSQVSEWTGSDKWRLEADARYRQRYSGTFLPYEMDKYKRGQWIPSNIAIGWVELSYCRPVVGARTAAQLNESLEPIPKEVVLSELNDMFPAPPPAHDRSEEA